MTINAYTHARLKRKNGFYFQTTRYLVQPSVMPDYWWRQTQIGLWSFVIMIDTTTYADSGQST